MGMRTVECWLFPWFISMRSLPPAANHSRPFDFLFKQWIFRTQPFALIFCNQLQTVFCCVVWCLMNLLMFHWQLLAQVKSLLMSTNSVTFQKGWRIFWMNTRVTVWLIWPSWGCKCLFCGMVLGKQKGVWASLHCLDSPSFLRMYYHFCCQDFQILRVLLRETWQRWSPCGSHCFSYSFENKTTKSKSIATHTRAKQHVLGTDSSHLGWDVQVSKITSQLSFCLYPTQITQWRRERMLQKYGASWSFAHDQHLCLQTSLLAQLTSSYIFFSFQKRFLYGASAVVQHVRPSEAPVFHIGTDSRLSCCISDLAFCW